MPTNRNTTAWQRVSNGAIILLGTAAAGDPIKNLVPGSLRWKLRHRERIPNMDRGVHGSITVGDQREQEVEFQLYRTSEFEALRALLMPGSTGTSGLDPGITFSIKIPDYLGASTGAKYEFTVGYLPDGFEDAADGGGADVDKVTVRINFRCDYPTPGTY